LGSDDRTTEVLTELTDSFWYTIGKNSAHAYARREEWLYRRVESIEFVGRESLRRRVSIDFEQPRLPSLKDRGARHGHLVPLSVLLKWPPLMDFDLRGPDGLPISFYKRDTNKQLDFGLLIGMAERLRLPLELPLKELLALLIDWNDPPQSAVITAVEQVTNALEPAHAYASKQEIEDVVNLAAQLANSTILWAPVVARRGCDCIVKFSYLEGAERSRPFRQIPISCSWRDRFVYIPLLHAGQHTRYHLDVRAPRAGIEFVQAQTRALPALPPTGTVGQREEPESQQEPHAEVVDRRAHIYHPARSAPSHRIFLILVIAATREGFISQCWAAVTALAIVMSVAYAELSSAAESYAGFVVLLAAIPLVLGYLLVRSEDPLEREGIIGIRAMAILAGTMPIVGGLALTFVPGATLSPPELSVVRPIWAGLTLASWLIVVGVTWSWSMAVSPGLRRERRVHGIMAASGGLSAAALLVASILVSLPSRHVTRSTLPEYLIDHRAIVLAAGALLVVGASALHGFIGGIRWAGRSKYAVWKDNAASAAVIAVGGLWLWSTIAAALLVEWQTMTIKADRAAAPLAYAAGVVIDATLVPAALLMLVVTVWLFVRHHKLQNDRWLLLVGFLAGGVPVALRCVSVLAPGFEPIASRVAWIGFAIWIACTAFVVAIPPKAADWRLPLVMRPHDWFRSVD
jgi:hypothetical protein